MIHTILACIIPIGVRGGKIYLAQTSQKRNLPEDGVLPRPSDIDRNATPRTGVVSLVLVRVVGDGLESKIQLVGLEPIRLKIVEVRGLEIGTSLLEPRTLLLGQCDFAEF